MTNTLKKVTNVVVLPERAASAAIPYMPARPAYTATETKQFCRLVTRTTGGTAPSLTKVVTIVDGKAVVTFVQIPGSPGVTTTTRVCEDVQVSVFYPARPEQKAQEAVTYRPRTVVQEFGIGWNAGARSIAELSGNGAATFLVPSASGAVVGFNDVDEDSGYLSIEHGLYFQNETFRVIELGVLKGSDATFLKTDTFKIERVGDQVRYYQNDALIYTSLEPSTRPVFLDVSLYSGGDIVDAPTLIGTTGGYSNASMRPMSGFASETSGWSFSHASMAQMTGAASDLWPRSNAVMRPMTGMATDKKYGESHASMRPMSGSASAGMLAPTYAVSAAQMMPMYGAAYGPEVRYGTSNAVMRPMTGMAVDKKYGESHAEMAPMQGYASDQPPAIMGILGGEISHFAIVTLATAPLVGLLSGSFTGSASTSILQTEPIIGVLGGGFTPYAEITLTTADMRGILGGSLSALADVVLQTEAMHLVLGGELGALSRLMEVFAMNITSGKVGGTTQYENYPFNSVAKIGGRYYGATDEGLFLLEGEDDAGDPIVSVFGLGQMNFGNPQVKTVTHCYLGAAAGAMRLEVDALVRGVPARYSYQARVYGSTMREMRFDLGKGMQSTYLTPTFYNDSGTPFEVDAVRFLIAESARRIGT
ncbi:hypothetical protein [Acidovorax radicis]|uniref:hypothetical protein n=1 Tax=Acidovorax radicis TaxID=758826 RepID=UPI001CFBC6F2|nr:hypothetical protein [Acidovorax radicis]UCV01143.1 hypothetical protein KI609_10720 [Acidovorax radicis]